MAGKSKQQPATAYDYRRVKALVDVLAIEDFKRRFDAINHLAHQWGIDLSQCIESSVFDTDCVVHLLARHALEHAREQGGENNKHTEMKG